MTQAFRRAEGGRIDRARPLAFTFDGRHYQGYDGDSLASALLANGVRLLGRSFKYHRPRGLLAAGVEEPNALVELREGARREPNLRATEVELFEGLTARSQNRWPSLAFDVGAINSLLSPLFPAGFYYKTFKWPPSWWMLYERFIRRAAGLGSAAREADPDHYEKRHAHADIAIVGGGPAGLGAALAAGRSGARVVLIDERRELGGSLLGERSLIGGAPALEWVAAVAAELAALSNVRLLTRTTAFGAYDHNTLALVERVADHLPAPTPFAPRQRLWTLRAREILLATGAIERPLVFGDNDRPGVMLASAARHYLNRYAVLPGRRAALFTAHDEAYRTALDLADAGIEVAAVVDPRTTTPRALAQALAERGIEILSGHQVLRARGGRALKGIEVAPLEGGSPSRLLDCDLLCVSGGWTPTIHLSSQMGAKPRWEERLAAFLPGSCPQGVRSIGATAGTLKLRPCLAEGLAAGAAAAAACGHGSSMAPEAPTASDEPEALPAPATLFPAKASKSKGKRFIDIQDDVTAADVALAEREGYASVEHLKRYTTLGMGTDQGKTANVNGLALMAALRGREIPEVGTTTFRPPYTPVALGALAGREVGPHFQPIRRTPLHDWHVKAGAVMVEAGLWLRPRYYPKAGESLRDAMNREAVHVRRKVGIVDVSTLGKIEVEGPDAAEFLDRVYINGFSKLPVGKARYGLMLREDGHVFDDGTTSRLSETRFFMTTTTANAAKVLSHLEHALQVLWPDLRVEVSSATDQWAGIALAGPRSRRVLAKAVGDKDVSDAALPFMGVLDATIAGLPVRIFRISFSGELAYEINTPSDYGITLWEALLEIGEEEEIVPYGLEALAVLRIEKGHVAGQELDGRTTPADLGMERMVSRKKPFIGQRLLARPGLADPKRPRLVGLEPLDGRSAIKAGAILLDEPKLAPPVEKLGHVTSVTWSENLGKPISLALLSEGQRRTGERLWAAFPLRGSLVEVRVVSPHFYDPEGKRLHGSEEDPHG